MADKKLLLSGKIYDCRSEETVLEALLRQKVEVPNICQRQVCLSCMMRSLNGPPPSDAQTNLKEVLKVQHFFLACGCRPERDMEIALAEETIAVQATARVAELNRLNPHVLELVLECDPPLHYRGGQSMTSVQSGRHRERIPHCLANERAIERQNRAACRAYPGRLFFRMDSQ